MLTTDLTRESLRDGLVAATAPIAWDTWLTTHGQDPLPHRDGTWLHPIFAEAEVAALARFLTRCGSKRITQRSLDAYRQGAHGQTFGFAVGTGEHQVVSVVAARWDGQRAGHLVVATAPRWRNQGYGTYALTAHAALCSAVDVECRAEVAEDNGPSLTMCGRVLREVERVERARRRGRYTAVVFA